MPVSRSVRARHGRDARRRAARGCSSSRSSLVLGIFYFIILLPMKRKQQKVPGSSSRRSRWATASSRPAASTARSRASASRRMQLQIADKVRIDVSPRGRSAAIRGRRRSWSRRAARTRRTRVTQTGQHHGSNLRWKLVTIIAVLVIFGAVGVYPIVAARYGVHSPSWLMDKQLKLGLDLKGGVHLVLRVQTDDALRMETEQEMERLRAELQTQQHHGRQPRRRRRSRSSGSTACRRRRTRRSGRRPPKSRPTSIAAPA